MNTSCPTGTDAPSDASCRYSVRLASTPEEVRAAQRLRFRVFNLELNEGLAASYAIERDEDIFDSCCDHLIVVAEDATAEGEDALPNVVGTYRLQTGAIAALHHGYYGAQEFDFDPYEPLRAELLELGRACVHHAHRNLTVLAMLWKAIASYAESRKCRYLIGCSSVTSQNPAVGHSLFCTLSRRHLCAPRFRTEPLPSFALPSTALSDPDAAHSSAAASAIAASPEPPRLLMAYLTIGAKICGPPAIDREFSTIDFLTILDLKSLSPLVRARILLGIV